VSPEHEMLEPAVTMDGSDRLRVRGEIDHDSAAAFGERVRAVLLRTGGDVRLDMSEVWFLDLAGIHQLLAIAAEGHRIVIVDPSPPARLLLELPSIRDRFEVRTGHRSASLASG